MRDLNTLNYPDKSVSDAVTAIIAALVGIAAMVVAWCLQPGGRPVMVLSWVLVVGGGTVAVVSPRRRPIAAGLAFAGVAPLIAAFLVMWVSYTGWVLAG